MRAASPPIVWGIAGVAVACLTACQHLPVSLLAERDARFGGEPESHPADPVALQTALANDSPFQPMLQQSGRWLRAGRDAENCNFAGLLEGGEDALLARLHLIGNARKSIELQTFIWADDECGRLLAEALVDAARRGVQVRVLADYLGIAKNAVALAAFAGADPNLQVRVYRPTARRLESGYLGSAFYAMTNFKGANQRMHNKVLVADEAVAITGGRNIENSYFDSSLGMNFKDRDILVAGPVAAQMARAFDDFWRYRRSVPADSLRDVARAIDGRPLGKPPATPVAQRLARLREEASRTTGIKERLIERMRHVASMEFVSDLPGKNGALNLVGSGRATAHILRALELAEREIWIQSPYLVLEGEGIRYFQRLRTDRPNLAIRVSTNSFGSTDNLVAYAGNVRSRERYVHQLGFLIGEYRPWPADLHRALPNYRWLQARWQETEGAGRRAPFVCIHAKSFVVDQDLAFVGSFNLDPRSAHLNTECGVFVRDASFASRLRQEIRRDLQPENCWWIAPRQENGELIALQMLSREVTDYSPIDVSILETAGAFELKPGFESVPVGHPDFYRNFRGIGSFPGAKDLSAERLMMGRLLRLTTPVMDPLL